MNIGDVIKFKDVDYYKSLGYKEDTHKYFFDNANNKKVVTKFTHDGELKLVFVDNDNIPLTDCDYEEVVNE